MKIDFAMLVSYDWLMSIDAIRRILPIANKVVIGYPTDGKSWTGLSTGFNFSTYYHTIRAHLLSYGAQACDRALRKIVFVPYAFPSDYLLDSSALQWLNKNLTFQKKLTKPQQTEVILRNHLSTYCDEGSWIVQIDADEMMPNPIEFASWLVNVNPEASVCIPWIQVWKVLPDHQCLIVDPGPDWDHTTLGVARFATTRPNRYVVGRANWCDRFEEVYHTPLLHYTLGGRTPSEVLLKLKSWGHTGDVDPDTYYELWYHANASNYTQLKNLAPFGSGVTWPRLKLVNTANLLEPYACTLRPSL